MTDQTRQTAVDPDALRAMLRREKIAARMSLPAAAHRAASVAVCHHLGEYLLARPVGSIAFCMPMRGEVDCRPLIERLLDAGWLAAMPVVRQLDAPMEFFAWWPAAPMTVDPYGIPVPSTHRTRDPDVMLLPLVAFDAAGYRLGYGGGYFDRTLAAMNPRPFAIGVGFDLGAVDDLKPQPHDIPLDLIVTESGIRAFEHH
ncbi:5-formyltetrahydrofolate cyclo-ligase [Sulfuricystis multivorans]|uniref:5-formyltetrahydrofolate cyclo-ligase n=1 Tax=Sulfuricystis multivorans TaxID=2211108 RepID=UPI000F830A85|nr:5-formyltetrahydrofolate cyclo-ligase [Sulfuricystis multivorans]